jgi:hypothetical protein
MRRVALLAAIVACHSKGATPDGTVLVDWRSPTIPAIPDHPLDVGDTVLEWEPKEAGGTFVFAVHVASGRTTFYEDGGPTNEESPIVVKMTLTRSPRRHAVTVTCHDPYLQRFQHPSGSRSGRMDCDVAIDRSPSDMLKITIDGKTRSASGYAGLGNVRDRPGP